MTHKVVVITGGSRGIGRATAIAAAARGFRVCVGYASNEAAASQVVSAIEGKNGKAIAVKCDVGEERDILAMFKAADAFGKLGALVNNAGIVGTTSRVDEMSAERIQRMMAVNVTGSILCAREAVKRMSTRHGGQGGVIVNLSSVAANLGLAQHLCRLRRIQGRDRFLHHWPRTRSRRRGHSRRRDLARTDRHRHSRLGRRARPRPAAQPMVPMKRVGTADEIASAIVWLMSDDASYVTSAILDVSGGR